LPFRRQLPSLTGRRHSHADPYGVPHFCSAPPPAALLLRRLQAFPPVEARRIIERIEVVHTPKHGSWLNMAECELSVLEKQCLGERIGDEPTLREGVGIWNTDRNHRSKKIDWQFKTPDARIKLRRLYPQIQME
jgi:hypothetical protein